VVLELKKKNVYASIYVLDPPAPHMDPSLLLASPLCLALSTSCHACICKMLHPQTLVRIGKANAGGGLTRGCRNREAGELWNLFLAPLSILPPTKNACGYSIGMSNQSSFLVTGYLTAGRIHFTNCHLVYSWSRLSHKQRLGFESLYRQGCGCHIQPCIMCEHPCPEPDVNECTWEQKDCDFRYWMEEQTINSMCFPGKSGQCKWTAIPLNGTKIIPS
uniref:Metalloproteinase inhibitor 1 n=1 Tax=Urocitellus parryii TaxID=9999 RepID=A0A8D2HCH7_UROPR